MAALPECILRQPTHSSMATEAHRESQTRYLTKRAGAERSRSVGGMCGSLTKGNLTDPPSFHLVNRLLFQLHRYFKGIIVSRRPIL